MSDNETNDKTLTDDALILFGGAVKALGKGKVGGYLVRYSDPEHADLEGEYFDASTDYGGAEKSVVYYDHGLDTTLGLKQLGEGAAPLDRQDAGVWIEAQLDMRDEYERAIYELAEKGKLGWSSGTAPHLVKRNKVGAAHHITHWPLGLDASLTPTPADPWNTAMPLKAWAEATKSARLEVRSQEDAPEAAQASSTSTTAADGVTVNVTIVNETPVEGAAVKSGTNATEAITMGDKETEVPAVETPAVDVEAVARNAADAAIKAYRAELAKEPPINPAGVLVTGDEADRALKGNSFKSFGEQLIAVKNAAYGSIDKRLLPLRAKAILGQSEQIASEGGFLIGTEQAPGLDKKVFESGVFASRVSLRTLAAGTNSVDFYGVDEDSRAAGSRFGGIRGYRVAEAGTITASKMSFYKYTLKPNKYAVLVYATDEVLQDQNLLEQEIMEAAPKELAFMLDDDIMNGTAGGYPRGALAAGCLVAVAKETGQAADTVVAENIINMWARRWVRGNYVWFVNQDVTPQLHQLNLPAGTSGQMVYMPPGGLSGAAYGTLYSAPVIENEYSATVGDLGDILLADFSQYKVAQAGGVQAASSIHVQFLTDQTAFRFTARYDGQATWKNALTPFKGTNTVSPFVALAARA